MRSDRLGRLRRLLDPMRYRDVLGEGLPFPPSGTRAGGRAALIRRAAWRARQGRFAPVLRAVAALAQLVAWPVLTLAPARIMARRRGQGVAGAAAIWWRAQRSGVTPLEQFAYRIPPDSPAEANRWFMHAEFCQLNAALASPQARAVLGDKAAFARCAAARGLPVPPTLALVAEGAHAMPPEDAGGIVVKPVRGFASKGLEAWAPAPGGAQDWRRISGAPMALAREGLGRRIAGLAARHGPMLIQPVVRAHPVLARPDLALPPVLRLVTGRAPGGRVVLAYATLWYSLAHAGAQRVTGITVIEPASGRPMVALPQRAPQFAWLAPLAALDLDDAPLPLWDGCVALVAAAHEMLEGGAPAVAWDVVITPEGPVLLEGNIGFSLYFQQTATGLPGSESALGPVFEAWLRRGAS